MEVKIGKHGIITQIPRFNASIVQNDGGIRRCKLWDSRVIVIEK